MRDEFHHFEFCLTGFRLRNREILGSFIRSDTDAMKDEVFKEAQPIADFAFGERVAAVFDDMLDRSVPFYRETQRMIAEMARDFAVDGTNVYDLGCSTGTTMINLDPVVPPGVKFI